MTSPPPKKKYKIVQFCDDPKRIGLSLRIQEVFRVYLNKFEIAIFIHFSLYFVIIDLHRLV